MPNLNLIAWDEINNRPKLSGKDASLVGTGQASNRVGQVTLNQNDLTKTVTFAVPMTSSNFSVNCIFYNAVDSSILYQDMTVTNKTVNGFTTKWNYPLDSNNYELHYTASLFGYAFVSGTIPLAQGITTKIVPITPPFADTNFVVTMNLYNPTDTDVIYQPLSLTQKITSQFVVKWNSPLPTANYVLEYQMNLI
jgi:hypothetical protein